jgi:FixJ family two-component response regulator
MNVSRLTVAVVDDDDGYRKALTRLLSEAGYEVRAFASATEFLVGKAQDACACVLLDVRMPGMSGLDLQEVLAAEADPLPVIFLTGFGDFPTCVRAVKAGAADFLTKPVPWDVLVGALEDALARAAARRAAVVQLRSARLRYDALTPRERQVFAAVVGGQPNKQIAAELGATERTVKAHRGRVMQKMGVRTLVDLVHIADLLQSDANGRP